MHAEATQVMTSTEQVTIDILRSVNDDPSGWDQAVSHNNLFLQRPYLTVLEQFPPKGLQFRYAIIRRGGEPIGVVYGQVLYFNGAESIRYQQASGPTACFFSTFGQFLRGLVARQVGFYSLVCGNLMLSGHHGFSFHEEPPDETGLVDQAMRLMRKELEAEGFPVSILLLKDFYPEKADVVDGFRQHQYHSFHILPSMVMSLRSEWNHYDDYLADLSSKYRVRAKKARKVLAKDVVRKTLSLEDVRAFTA